MLESPLQVQIDRVYRLAPFDEFAEVIVPDVIRHGRSRPHCALPTNPTTTSTATATAATTTTTTAAAAAAAAAPLVSMLFATIILSSNNI